MRGLRLFAQTFPFSHITIPSVPKGSLTLASFVRWQILLSALEGIRDPAFDCTLTASKS